MASRDHQGGYSKYYSGRLSNLTAESTDDDVKRVYDGWARDYDKDLKSAGCVNHKPFVEFFDKAINEVYQGSIAKSEVRMIDAGAGTGLIGVELKNLGYSCIDALDISQEMLNMAKEKNAYRKFICAPLSDQRTPGVATDEYDALVCCGTLILAHVRPAAFDEIIRMVRNGGLICFTIREDGHDEFTGKIAELESQRMWTLVQEGRVPHYNSDDMPRECRAFVYKVTKN